MNPIEFDKNENYFENLQTITNFFKRYNFVGFLFAVANFRQVVKDVNLNVVNESTANGKTVTIIELEWNGETGIITQLERYLKENPSNGLIINNIDELIKESNGEIIYSLNYAREGLIALNIPILFWLNDENHARFSLEAIDLYLRRDFSTVFFEDINLSQKHPLLNTVFSDKHQTTEDFQNLRIRIELLEKQLHEAEKKGYPPQKIAKEIVFDLCTGYKALSLHNEAYNLMKNYETYFDLQSSNILNLMGCVYLNVMNYEKAEYFFEKAQSIDLKMFGQHHETFILNLKLRASTYRQSGNYQKALELNKLGLKESIKIFGEESLQTAAMKSELSLSYSKVRDISNAKKLSEQALCTATRIFGDNDIHLTTYISNWASFNTILGNFKIAKELFEKVLKIEIQFYGENHIYLSQTYDAFSYFHREMGNINAALYYAQKAFDICKNTFNISHPLTQKYSQYLQSLQQKSLTQSEA